MQYLDCGKGQWLNFDPSTAEENWPYLDCTPSPHIFYSFRLIIFIDCRPHHNWRQMYTYNPLHLIPTEHHHLIIGGEAHLWAELTDATNLDSMLWPRAAAAAEVLWSGARDDQGRNRSQIEAAPRLADMRERLVARGVGAEVVQMAYCTMEGGCQLGVGG
jgi:hexosaminidase